MATTTRWKMIPWVLGIACLAITLIGANNLLQPAAPQDRGTVMPTLKANGPASLGPVVNGTVATEVEIGEYVAPEVLQLAKVTKILVKQNQLVKVGDPLIQFDDTQPKKKMEVAQAAVGTAKVSVAKAELAKKIHPKNISLQNLAINKATVELNAAKLARSTLLDQFERLFQDKNQHTGLPWTPEEKQRYLRDSLELTRLNGLNDALTIVLNKENIELEKVLLINPELAIDEAKAELARMEANVNEAQAIVDACVLKSGVAGTVERITVAEGAIVSPASPKPSIIVIPSGTRLVRAEVVPEFAHKLAGSEGRKVVIYDNDNFNLTYEGTVERIGEAFLPRRFGSQDMTNLNANRVLECTIRVTDPAPAGKPPLRHGQPVRVSFP